MRGPFPKSPLNSQGSVLRFEKDPDAWEDADMKRSAAVAGAFYPSKPAVLREMVQGFLNPDAPKESVLGIVVPHAGFIYSGPVAAATYSGIVSADTYILMGPNHTGRGERVALMASGSWETPLGEVPIDSAVAADLRRASSLIAEDAQAHREEHCLEVQLPFLQCLTTGFRIVPLCLSRLSYPECEHLGKAVAGVMRSYSFSKEVILVASSDMNHYESQEITFEKDHKVIDVLLTLDPEAFFRSVREYHDSMCGYLPATVLLVAARELGAREAKLVSYATSGDVSGDTEQVVGYAGILIQ